MKQNMKKLKRLPTPEIFVNNRVVKFPQPKNTVRVVLEEGRDFPLKGTVLIRTIFNPNEIAPNDFVLVEDKNGSFVCHAKDIQEGKIIGVYYGTISTV